MRILRLFAIAALALLLCPAMPALASAIPEYTPNVVDPAGVLSDAQQQRVNAALQRIRDEQHIWGAVYLVPSLEGEDIERVADDAFRTWQLGDKDANNGLLLVLSMQDRRSRFEVGYGLEGVLPDVVARRALDDHLAPKMREGDTAGAIVDAFGFMARVAAKDPDSLAELARPPSASERGDQSDWKRGVAAWAGLLALIWLLPPLLERRQRRLRTRLLQRHPELADAPEEIAASSKRASSGLFIKLFLTVNPGVFVLILSALFPLAFWLWIAAELLALGLALALSGRRYRSPQRYRRFLKQQERTRNALIRKGHVVETGTGAFAYTAAYYASEAASSGSSSSTSSSSSSSGGGSSGGGGASSSW
ncbi:YgcG family protein [Xanthomonas sp. NCPPB 3005]|uniref:TPM domain-containing protein n=1 Tax=Xanthomonas sp. NCPPB 3005 TaxID=3240913 RepID=UPI0035118F8F